MPTKRKRRTRLFCAFRKVQHFLRILICLKADHITSGIAEFEGAETLLVSEVNMLLEHRKTQNESADDDQELSEVFKKTLEYTQRFSKYKNRESIAAVRR